MKLIAEFEIQDLPPTINTMSGKHWGVRHRESRRWYRLILDKAKTNQIFGLELEKAHLTLTRHSSHELDVDNLCGSWKYPLDGLVKAKVIKDDKPSVIGAPIFLWQKAAQKKGKITIKIEVED